MAHHAPLFVPNDTFVGVSIQTVGMSGLSREIARVFGSDERQTPFVLYGRGQVLAHPLPIGGNLDLRGGEKKLPTPGELGDSVLGNIWNPDEISMVDIPAMEGDTTKGISFGDRVFLFAFRMVEGYGSKPWVVGTYFDGENTRTQVRRLALVGGGGVVIGIRFLILAVVFGRAAGHPMRRLARAARAVRNDEIEQIQSLPRSRFRELDDASVGFNEMIDGLRESQILGFRHAIHWQDVPSLVLDGILQQQLCDAELVAVIEFFALQAVVPLSNIRLYTPA